jgi:hypothetical protein
MAPKLEVFQFHLLDSLKVSAEGARSRVSVILSIPFIGFPAPLLVMPAVTARHKLSIPFIGFGHRYADRGCPYTATYTFNSIYWIHR